jgi:hypothetical protein
MGCEIESGQGIGWKFLGEESGNDLKKALQESQLTAPKWKLLAASPQTEHTFAGFERSLGRNQ